MFKKTKRLPENLILPFDTTHRFLGPFQSNTVLLTALNTLAVIDRVTPLPVALAQAAVDEAPNPAREGQGQSAETLAKSNWNAPKNLATQATTRRMRR
jgi:hypothetical protein